MTSAGPAIAHIGLLCDDIESVVSTWNILFGLSGPVPAPWFAAEEGVLTTNLPIPGCGLEPLQPIVRSTAQWTQLRAGRRPFHLSLQVDDLSGEVERLRRAGLLIRVRKAGRVVTLRRAWLDPDECAGITVELLDAGEVEQFRSMPAKAPDRTEQRPAGSALDWRVTRALAVGHTVRSITEAVRFYRMLGFTLVNQGRRPRAGWSARQQVTAASGAPVELVARPPGTRWPAGLSHLTLAVDDLHAAWRWLDAQEAWLARTPAQGDRPAMVRVDARSTHGLDVFLVAEDDAGQSV
ncbi:hypothetical protein FPZ12_008540 [Amycolatopsis acidicola]|uniref:VOC domain-containing protein n=1 Tax=Amycolatopsis acidicola TaxID=2596893 RepID=A0A5N0VFA3_9PSEU|nr:VOC family protein [Amycolatopsis acidicola]KAA9164053.1 hypothetical protein FPZ12_008540 [Amycolatopsis acidicola]